MIGVIRIYIFSGYVEFERSYVKIRKITIYVVENGGVGSGDT